MKRQQSQTTRNRKIRITAIGSVIAVIIVVIVIFVTTTRATVDTATPAAITGVITFPMQTPKHVTGTVDYSQTPPVGGDHAEKLLNCGIYSEAIPNENAVHSIEHGAVWITYDAAAITGDQLATLRAAIPATHAILSPFPGLPASIVASAWGVQLKISDPVDPRLAAFISKYRGAASAPEPGAPCTGGLDGPGRVS